MALGRDAILSADDLKLEEVKVPEWGGTVFVRGMTGHEREQFDTLVRKEENHAKMRVRMVLLCACDEKGKRIFLDSDADAVGQKNADALQRVSEKALELSGIVKADEAEKNSEAAPAQSNG